MPKVTYKNTNQVIEVEVGKMLKDITKENNWNIPFGCESGTCGTCLIEVESGMKNLSPMEETEQMTLTVMGLNDGKHRLTCQCKVNGDIVIKGP